MPALDIGSVAEAAEACNVTKQTLSNWTRRYKSFPKPIAKLAMGPIWDLAEIRRWHKQRS